MCALYVLKKWKTLETCSINAGTDLLVQQEETGLVHTCTCTCTIPFNVLNAPKTLVISVATGGICKVLHLLNSLCTHDVLVSAAGELNPYNAKIDLLILDSGTFCHFTMEKERISSIV